MGIASLEAPRVAATLPAAYVRPDVGDVGRMSGPLVLLASTTRLASTARLAMEFHDAGAAVALVSPGRHPAGMLGFLAATRRYRASAPISSLEAALRALQPDLVIPCDERTVRHLHTICRRTTDGGVRALIERCCGEPAHYDTITSRAHLLALAEREGVRTPPNTLLPDAATLRRWTASHPAPFVLKADGSSSGFGVRLAADPVEAAEAFADLQRPVRLGLALRESVLEGNHFVLPDWLRRQRPALSVQGFVDGWPANIGVACWQGEVLASTCVEAVATERTLGPSTVSRVIQSTEMTEAARRIVRALGLSGLIGFDFMIEAATSAAYLIEMNPRSTPVCALRLGGGRDLTEALLARVMGRPVRERPPRTERDIIVAFPETWMLDPGNSFLRSGYHDVPWEQPALVRHLMQPAGRDRYRLLRMLRARRARKA
jgi:hypothetical protein